MHVQKQKIDELNRANNIDPPKKRQKKKLRMDPNATDKERKKKELEESLQRAKLSRKLNYAAISQLEELDKDLEEGTVFSKDSTAAIGYKTEDGKDMTTAVSAGASTETPSASAVTTVGGGIKRKTMAAEDLDAYSDLDDELLHADDYNESDDEAKKQTQAMQALLGKGPDVDNVGADGTYQFSDDEEAEDFDF
ncbi:hypothetical protein SARC_08000 [Sphaeroforma arctica JP610]|uniref:Uncharacterized protein n=1 Tax=Sphaeroforma arctica JP610 TaxID=667725 RepID=A0A0L0FS46_9EUKA|nr:hypothetical protein SARC_08000 [Sphaeroforma arctica JP610]KNC79612.1 hypothetical protein SARC_08000 [Sphaeroforma arctica JP610]|eukprot:XP_014153514.1 hypothetical protein SARC_08000 [Sphaeroforma arctica JP610]